MFLNTLKKHQGSSRKAKRVGRGSGSGYGKTAGRGHKGQKSRSGGYHKVGFEGGQMPLQRRLPKVGFASKLAKHTAEVRLHELSKIKEFDVDLDVLKNAKIVSKTIMRAKVIATGTIDKAINLKGIKASASAKKKIEKAGGKIEK
jgi:large subunit ribosomal protein L15